LRIKAALESASSFGFSEWVDVNVKDMSGTFRNIPERSELAQDINEQLVVELYSK
jgi:small subunit ribosomal protein S4